MESSQDVVAKEEESAVAKTGGPQYLTITSLDYGSAHITDFGDFRGDAFPGSFMFIRGVRLEDESIGTVYEGTIHMQMKGEELRAVPIAVFTRLLDPFQGRVLIRVLGYYTINNPTLATIDTNSVLGAKLMDA